MTIYEKIDAGNKKISALRPFEGHMLAIIPPICRAEYHAAIRKYQNEGQPDAFCEFLADRVHETQKEIMRLFHVSFP